LPRRRPALKLYNSGGIGIFASYNGGNEQMRIGSDGYLYAGNNAVRLSRNGLWLKMQGQDIIGIGGTGHVNFGDPATQTLQGAMGGIYTSSTAYTLRMFMDATNAFLTFTRSSTSYTAQLKATQGLTLTANTITLTGAVDAGSTLQVQSTLTVLGASTLTGGANASTFLRSTGYIVAGSNSVTGNTGEVIALFRYTRRDGTTNYPGAIYVPRATAYAQFTGGAVSATTYNITAAAMGYASQIVKAVAVRLSYQSSTLNALGYCYPRGGDATKAGAVARTSVSGTYDDDSGVVECDSTGDFSVTFTAAGNAFLYVLGVFM
jgi:hypothetical protein